MCTDGVEGASGVSSSRRAPRPTPAPWLASKDGAYAVSINWSAESKEDFVTGNVFVVGKLAKGKMCSSNMTSLEIYTLLEGTWRHLYPLCKEL
jgi:hypothetical protein